MTDKPLIPPLEADRQMMRGAPVPDDNDAICPFCGEGYGSPSDPSVERARAAHDELLQLRERVIELTEAPIPRHDPPDLRYDLRLRLNRGVRWLREAEDIARIEMPAWPTADRIRSIYEQVTADVLDGKTTKPPIARQLTEAQERIERLEAALRSIILIDGTPTYEYGQPRARDRERPPAGERWMTPREKAQLALDAEPQRDSAKETT